MTKYLDKGRKRVYNDGITKKKREDRNMKIGGVIRTIDKLGRVVIPKSMCKALGIQADDELDVTMEGERIILQKCRNGCVFCDSTDRLVLFNGRKVCGACVESLSDMK